MDTDRKLKSEKPSALVSPTNAEGLKLKEKVSTMSPSKRFKTLRKAEKKKITPLEDRKKCLEEIFYFYAR